ncbi:hypothetical protein GCM10007036_32310 [Alsobacter metallidurans]|uniref:Ribosomal large subunit pseudouridine synthase D n=1 Tax=Alsobacter metallidurans TaxID=340221 RepID=A0A917MIS4_9HYPH|nr:RluA family pseudouridine synthase [Alsobacter metallidurans]GGH25284.1 hypothetical protein GCM10007036_32310 [Alsobacter metallidurans]
MSKGGPKRPGATGGRAGRVKPGSGPRTAAGGPRPARPASRSAAAAPSGRPPRKASIDGGRARSFAPDDVAAREMPTEGQAPRRTKGWAPSQNQARTERRARERAVEQQPEQEAPVEVVAEEAVMTKVQTVTVTADEAGMRIDRFLEARFPGLSFSHIQRVVRKGELRVNGKRAETKDRLEEGQAVRIPPLSLTPPKTGPRASKADEETRAYLKSITLYEDDDMLVIDKPMGLAVQGGSGMTNHVDKMLEALTDSKGQTPRLVHRLDRDTSGCLVIAKTRFAASALAKSFRSRDTRKTYWALVAGVPRVKQGRISTYLAKGEDEDGDAKMHVAKHGAEGATHAVTYYAVVETAAQKLAWLSLKPVTGRTHQLRAHTVHIGHPIVGDPKYFDIENWELPGGIQNRLHLLARRIVIPHPRSGKPVDVTAPLPPHMRQSWNLLGFDTARYDPIEDAPEL